jgi:enoyl-CoA hydratase/carnithine racemase
VTVEAQVTDSSGADAEALVLLEMRNDIAIVTLNRPEKRNAMSRPAQRRLVQVLEQCQQARVRAIVLTGAGDVSFCAGVDRKDQTPTDRPTATQLNSWQGVQRLIAEHPAVFIAAVNGYALGGGLTLVHNCDLAIAAEGARFGCPEITFGIYPALAGPSTVQRLLPKHAAQLVLTGEQIDATTALQWGLVNEVVPAGRLLSRAEQLARLVASHDPVALDVSRQALRTETAMGWHEAIDHGTRTTYLIRELRQAAQS